MSKFTQFLQKARLLEDDAPPSQSTDDAADTLAQDSVPANEPVPAGGAHVLQEGVAFEEVFRQAGVPDCPFPVERLAKLVEGLKQLDPGTQQAAILAMDSADDTWQIDDVLKDAQAKSGALRAYGERTAAQARRMQDDIDREISALDAGKESSFADIRAQIATLQGQLEEVISRHAADVASLGAQKGALVVAAERERQRVSEYNNRINNLIHPYLTPAQTR